MNKLTVKDFVMTGVFAALYLVLSFVIGTPLGILVVTYLAYPFCWALVSGIITMFFMAKCPKQPLTLLFTLLPGLAMILMGTPIITLVYYAVCALLAEIARNIGGLRSIKGMKMAHIFISLTSLNSFLLIFMAKDIYYQLTVKSMGEAYAKSLTSLPLWSLFALFLSVIPGAILGGMLGEAVLKKHFKKVGIE